MRSLSNGRQRRSGLRAAVASIAVMLALTLTVGVAFAQTGTIVGTITDQATKAPVPSVQIQIVGTTRGVITGSDGHYRLPAVASGPTQLRATRIGYAAATQTVSVPTGDVATVDFALAATQITLDQVVVTGTQETQRERESGNLVAVISTDSINKAAVSTFSDLIAAKAAGVDITQASGEVGTSSRIRIRGSNSISLNNDPLLVIDGVFVDNSSNSLSSGLFTGGQTTSRFDDLNPAEIENVEILKGPSASALYGTAGANGVILVTTKKGAAGRAVWTAHADYGGVSQAAIYPANYGQVGAITGAPPGTETTRCTLVRQAAGVCTPVADSLLQWNPLMSSLYSPFTHGNARYLFGGSVAGGSDVTKYFVSGDFNNEHGVQASSFQTRNNGRANLQGTPNSKTDFGINAGYFQSRLHIPSNDNNEASAIATAFLGAPINYTVPTGPYLAHGYLSLISPAQSDSIVTSQDVERFTAGVNGNWRPIGWLTITGTGGIDVTNREDFQLLPIGVESAFNSLGGTGFATSNPNQTQVYTTQLNASAQENIGSDLHGTSTLGTQYSNTILRNTGGSGFGIIAGTSSVSGAANQFAAAQTANNQVVDIGYYGQQQFGWRDKMFVTAALRLDDNSAFGQAYVPSYYPSVSGSWVIGEEPWFPRGSFLSSLRLRSAYGFSGQHPVFQQASTFYGTVSAFLPTAASEAAGLQLGGIGNTTLKPERSGEVEAGFDAGFWRDRVTLQFTGYSKTTTNALVAVNLPPSVGGITVAGPVQETSTRFENLGQIDNRGVEASLTANLINQRNTRLDVTVNTSYNKNKVITLGPGVAPIFFTSGTNAPNLQAIKAGLPAGAWYQPSYTYSDKNHDGIIDPSEVNVAATSSFVGNRDPSQLFSVNPQLTVLRYFKLSTLFDRQSGFSVLDFGSVFRCVSFSNCQWDYDPHTSLANQARVAAVLATNPVSGEATNAGFVEDGSFWKWRELSLRASAPDSWAGRLHVSSLSFTIAGRNLRTWTKYNGVDPEINSTPAFNFAQAEFFTQGSVRFWTGRFDITF